MTIAIVAVGKLLLAQDVNLALGVSIGCAVGIIGITISILLHDWLDDRRGK